MDRKNLAEFRRHFWDKWRIETCASWHQCPQPPAGHISGLRMDSVHRRRSLWRQPYKLEDEAQRPWTNMQAHGLLAASDRCVNGFGLSLWSMHASMPWMASSHRCRTWDLNNSIGHGQVMISHKWSCPLHNTTLHETWT